MKLESKWSHNYFAIFFVAGFVISICSSAFWIGIVISNQLGPVLLSSPLGVSGTLLVFSANVLFLFIFVLLSLPETKVKS